MFRKYISNYLNKICLLHTRIIIYTLKTYLILCKYNRYIILKQKISNYTYKLT